MGGVADPPPTVGIEPRISALAEVDNGPVAGSPLLSFTMGINPLWSLQSVKDQPTHQRGLPGAGV